MAKLELNALMNALHGTIGNLVLVRDGDNIYVRRRAEKKAQRTESQVAHNSSFGLASRWARMILSDPAVRAVYQRRCRGHLTAHNVAVSDFIGRGGEKRTEYRGLKIPGVSSVYKGKAGGRLHRLWRHWEADYGSSILSFIR